MKIDKAQLPSLLFALHSYGPMSFAQGIAEILIWNPEMSLYDIAIASESICLPTYFAAKPISKFSAVHIGLHPATKRETQDVLRFCASKQELVDVLADIGISEEENLERLKTAGLLAMRNGAPSLS